MWEFFNVYPRHKCAYIKINKVATQSLLVACEKAFGKGISGCAAAPDFFTFAFVRNPYDRLVSCWLNQIASPSPYSRTLFKGGMHAAFWRYPGLHPKISFSSFVRVIAEIPDEIANPHFKGQAWFLTGESGQLLPQFIGRFETLQEDFNRVCREVGVPRVQLLHRNRTAERYVYKRYYKRITKELTERRYARDLELFGYEWGKR